MAIFKKNEPQPQKPRDRPPIPSRGNQADGAISIIGQGMSVVGDIATEGIVRVEGEVQGTIRAGKAVILGQGGLIEGNVFTDDAVVGGTVRGSIVAENRLELQATCTVEGEIHVRPEHLKLEEGARFAGQVHMLEASQPEDQSPETIHSHPIPPVYSTPVGTENYSETDVAARTVHVEHAAGGMEMEGTEEEESEQQEQRKKA